MLRSLLNSNSGVFAKGRCPRSATSPKTRVSRSGLVLFLLLGCVSVVCVGGGSTRCVCCVVVVLCVVCVSVCVTSDEQRRVKTSKRCTKGSDIQRTFGVPLVLGSPFDDTGSRYSTLSTSSEDHSLLVISSQESATTDPHHDRNHAPCRESRTTVRRGCVCSRGEPGHDAPIPVPGQPQVEATIRPAHGFGAVRGHVSSPEGGKGRCD